MTSKKEMNCLIASHSGNQEPYAGTIRKFGLVVGATDKGVLAWDVFAPAAGPERGALAGDYVGVDASATVGAGFGANALVGGFNRSSHCSLCRFKRRPVLLSPPALRH